MRRLLFTVLSVLVLALAACGGDDGGGSGDGGGDPARLMPADSVFYVEGVVRPEGDLQADVEALAGKVLRTDDAGAKIKELIDDGLQEERKGASYDEDIEPWLGERVGITGINLAADEPNFLAAIAIKDADAAQKFIAEDTEGGDERSYEGVDYVRDSDDTFVGVVSDDFIGLADTDAGFKRLVDASKDRNLAEVERFTSAVDELPDDRMGALWVDPKEAVELAKASPDTDPAAIAVLEQSLRGIAPITAALLADDDSATIESRTRLPKEGAGSALGAIGGSGEAPEVLKSVPGDATAAFAVAQLGQTVRNTLKTVAGGVGSALLDGQLEQELGLNLERDVLSWIGDVAIYVRGNSLSTIGGALIIEATDADRAEAALPKIVGAARQGLGAPFDVAEVEGADRAFAAPLPGGPGPLVLAQAGDRVVLAVGDDAAAEALDPSETIEDSGLYERASEALDGPDPAILIDGAKLVGLISEAAAGDPDFAQAKPYLDLLDLITAGSEKDGDVIRQRFTVKVK